MADHAITKVERCETIIGYQFTSKALCLQALHTFAAAVHLDGRIFRVPKNGAIAVLGDTILKSHLCQLWFSTGRPKGLNTPFHRLPPANKSLGDFNQILAELSTNSHLNEVGRFRGLDACVYLSDGTKSVSDKTMSTVVEAIIGAVHQDGGGAAVAIVLGQLGLLRHEFLPAADP